MGIFDWLTGTKETTGTSRIAEDTDVETSKITGTTSGKSTAIGKTEASTQTAVQRLLDPETESMLKNLMATLGTGAPAGADLSALSSQFAGRTATGDVDVGANIADILASARVTGERELGQAGQRISTEAGSSLNSLVQMLQGEGRADLETKLAGVGGQLSLAAREQGTNEFAKAIEALGGAGEAQAGQMGQIGELLKGATTTTDITGRTEAQTTEQSVQQVLEVLEQLVSGKTIRTGDETSKTPGTLLDLLNSLGSFTSGID